MRVPTFQSLTVKFRFVRSSHTKEAWRHHDFPKYSNLLLCSIGGSFILDDFIDCPKEIRGG
ncbi:hypothetical protein [Leptospira noguchii]|uniref:Uncharacterized protein n=1 Tax=Leptospira noguchii TaxID=28182 RepID=M6V3V9_9LEPT|nr:hypothetical protein [Leptospira noguchii]EMO52112.1 hypothetical protein LEP1GSC172_0805 [Leptospira noguchii]